MSDPIRRSPAEFLRVLKKMAHSSHWQKSMFFASRGRMIGFELGREHYNHVLYSQAVWGRAAEIIQVIQAMQDDAVEPDGVSYYYIVNGLANVDHGYSSDFNINARLESLQHWRVALEALLCCRANGYDITGTMYNSAIVTCTIPTMNHWREAVNVYRAMREEEHVPHKVMVDAMYRCLVRNRRAVEATLLLQDAADVKVTGYEQYRSVASTLPDACSSGGKALARAANRLTEEEEQMLQEQEALRQPGDCVPPDAHNLFRPMVWRGLWWRWHAVANKYRPKASLRRKQLAPKFSPAGIPGWKKK